MLKVQSKQSAKSNLDWLVSCDYGGGQEVTINQSQIHLTQLNNTHNTLQCNQLFSFFFYFSFELHVPKKSWVLFFFLASRSRVYFLRCDVHGSTSTTPTDTSMPVSSSSHFPLFSPFFHFPSFSKWRVWQTINRKTLRYFFLYSMIEFLFFMNPRGINFYYLILETGVIESDSTLSFSISFHLNPKP